MKTQIYFTNIKQFNTHRGSPRITNLMAWRVNSIRTLNTGFKNVKDRIGFTAS